MHVAPDTLVLIAGASGRGKSAFAKLLTERMTESGFEFCVIDPEGDYIGLWNAVTIGSPTVQPATEEALRLLLRADINVVVNVLALSQPQRRALLATLLASIGRSRARSGRPHWLIVDEAHQLLSLEEPRIRCGEPGLLGGTILITADPAALAPEILNRADVVLALGRSACVVLASLAALLNTAPPEERTLLADDVRNGRRGRAMQLLFPRTWQSARPQSGRVSAHL